MTALESDLERQAVAIGRLHASMNRTLDANPLARAEFQVFSQYGDDGIISYLIDRVDPPVRRFVEFGVEDYSEANTRFLLVSRNWSGLIMDGRADLPEMLRSNVLFRRHDLTVRSAFITAENIEELLAVSGFAGPLGLLSIDIDGNDYWVWKAIRNADPAVVVCEFNSVFGPANPWTVPYDPDFQRTRYHHSNLVYGSSLTSLCDLAADKGYAFVGCNSAGNNAYFVKRTHLGSLRAIAPDEGFVESAFSESRDAHGRWTFLKGQNRLRSIRGVEIFNTRTGAIETIA